MTSLITRAIICSMRSHGEHGAIVRALTEETGLVAGYVRGGRSRALRPVLIPSNIVQAEFRARTAEQLAGLTVELVHSRAPILSEPLAADAIAWVCALTAASLPEEQPYPDLYYALGGLLDAIEAAPSARNWGAALVRYEYLLLARLGFAPDISRCVASGSEEDLAFVSPKSHQAVSRGAARGYEAKLLPLPAFLVATMPARVADIIDGLRLTGHFLEASLFGGTKRHEIFDARERLVERFRRL